MNEVYIQKGDFQIGDRVKILWENSSCWGEKGTVIKLEQCANHVRVTVRVDGGKKCFVGLRSSLKKMGVTTEKVVFT